MFIQRMTAFDRQTAGCLLLPLIFMLLGLPPEGRSGEPGGEIKVENIQPRQEGSFVIITYDLVGPEDETYDVELTLIYAGDPSLIITPASVTGDVGKGRFAGIARRIVWDFRKDYPQGFRGEEYQFRVTAEIVSGGSSWLWLGIGLLVDLGSHSGGYRQRGRMRGHRSEA